MDVVWKWQLGLPYNCFAFFPISADVTKQIWQELRKNELSAVNRTEPQPNCWGFSKQTISWEWLMFLFSNQMLRVTLLLLDNWEGGGFIKYTLPPTAFQTCCCSFVLFCLGCARSKQRFPSLLSSSTLIIARRRHWNQGLFFKIICVYTYICVYTDRQIDRQKDRSTLYIWAFNSRGAEGKGGIRGRTHTVNAT